MIENELTNPWLLALIPFLFSGAGGYLGSYLQKKGENLATREDIDGLVEQMSAVTKATEEIKAKISSDVWDRQKQWELKRDITFEAAKTIGAAKDALARMHAVYTTEKLNEPEGKPARNDVRAEVYGAFNDAADELEAAAFLMAIACGPKIVNTVNEFVLFVRQMGVDIAAGKPEVFLQKKGEFVEKYLAIAIAIKREVGFNVQLPS